MMTWHDVIGLDVLVRIDNMMCFGWTI